MGRNTNTNLGHLHMVLKKTMVSIPKRDISPAFFRNLDQENEDFVTTSKMYQQVDVPSVNHAIQQRRLILKLVFSNEFTEVPAVLLLGVAML